MFIAKKTIAEENPELLKYWDFEKNKELGLSPYILTAGSGKKIWWKCDNGHSYFSSIDRRKKGSGCPYCSNQKVLFGYNDLFSIKPELIEEWNWDKNTIDPKEIYFKSNKSVWWKCNKGHEWKTTVYSRVKLNTNCPYCSNNKILIGYNDLYTLRPDLRKYFLNEEDSKKYTIQSGKKAKLKCPICGKEKEQVISSLVNDGFACHFCSDKVPFGEKVIFFIFNNLNINFEREKVFCWAKNKRYDFYIPSLSCIIETNGMQHYKNVKSWNKTLEKQKENDKLKEQLAKENGIKHYIILDCRKSEMEWIKNSILNSELNELFDLSNVDWKECEKFSEKSLLVKICNNWNNGMNSKEIREKYELSITTVNRYLNIGNEIGLCKYNTFEVNKRRNDIIWVYSKELDEYYTMSECKKIFNFNYNKLIRLIKENEKIKGYSFVFKKPPMNYKRGDIYETFL